MLLPGHHSLWPVRKHRFPFRSAGLRCFALDWGAVDRKPRKTALEAKGQLRPAAHTFLVRWKFSYPFSRSLAAHDFENGFLRRLHHVRMNVEGRPVPHGAVDVRRKRDDVDLRVHSEDGVADRGALLGIVQGDEQKI